MHVIGVPQIAPHFGAGLGNVIFDGPGEDEDFGLEQITGNAVGPLQVPHLAAPQRRAAAGVLPQRRVHAPRGRHPAPPRRLRFGARTTIPRSPASTATSRSASARSSRSSRRIDPLLATPIDLSEREFNALVAFVRDGLLDERASKQRLCDLVPDRVPSGFPTMRFDECSQRKRDEEPRR